MVKNLPAMQETRVRSLCREDPLEKGMAIHFSILAWRISWTEKPCRLQLWGCKEMDTTERLTHTTQPKTFSYLSKYNKVQSNFIIFQL